MPWTLSHPLAVVPLQRFTPRPLSFSALIIGSMTPDLGYYIDRFDLSTYSHTLPGTIFACVPVGLVLLALVYLFARPVCYSLPSPHRQALLPVCPRAPRSLPGWLVVLLSLLLGAWTHTFWDAFTHEDAFFVTRLPWLQTVLFQQRGTPFCVYLGLQEFSTIAGFFFLLYLYWRWLRKQQVIREKYSGSDKWRYLLWIGATIVSFAISIPLALHKVVPMAHHDFRFERGMLFYTAVYAPWIFLPLVLGIGTVAYRRRDLRLTQDVPCSLKRNYERKV